MANPKQNNGVLDYIQTIGQNDAGIKAGGQIAGGVNLAPKPSNGLPPTNLLQDKRKRQGMSSIERNDRVMNMEQENNALKERKNLLEVEVKKMETKLRRIEALMRSRGNLGDTNYDQKDLQKDLQAEFDNLKAQNEFTKEKVRKLAVIQRGLSSRPATAAKPNKYAHVQGKLEVTSGKASHQYTQLADDLRKQLTVNEREILNLQTQLNKINHQSGDGKGNVDKIRQEIQEMFGQIRDHNVEIENLQANFAQNETIFKQSKNYTAEIQKQIMETSEKNEHLKMANSRLHWQTVEATDLEREIQSIAEERDTIERNIRNVTSEPFLRKEGQSMQARMAELELKVKEKSRIALTLREEEAKKAEIANKARSELQKLTGERDYLAGEHKKASEDFKAKHGNRNGPNSVDAMNGLNKMDPKRYEQMMTDLAMGGGNSAAPSWATLPFLDRMPTSSNNDPKTILQDEIKVLQLEKSGFAQELEKAQNLLKLQTDIERENTQYFQQEIKRLTLIEKSSSAKLEELARRADEKQKLILDMERRLYPAKTTGSPAKRSGPYDDDVQSEFSAITNESEIMMDENILDFKVEDAELYQNVLQTIPNLQDVASSVNRALITLCTVDFYNHTTETTQMGEGLRPNFQTQFSFKNKVDDFYVAFLQRQPLKIDVYVSKNNAAVHLGRCEVILKELIEREAHHIESKTPLIQNWVQIYAIGQENNRPIGTLKYKMRLRKPIQESMRYYREKAEIQNMTKAAQLNLGTLQPPKRLITIQIVGAHNLKFKYSQVSDVAPFFYYQFFTFDERYGSNSAGINPRFDDSYSYEVTFDARAIQYFETQNLEVILFDDNAPLSGQAPNAAGGDDMIGTCKIPLKSLVSGCSFHEKFPIIIADSNLAAGQLEVKISVIDLDKAPADNFSRTINDVTELHYGKEWESDLILRIARPLAKFNVEIGLLFGVFSRGMRTCTKEDFKYCCLTRLGLRTEISEREIDLFLMGNNYFKDQNYIERDDFVTVFEAAIQQAKHENLNNDAFNNTLERDYGKTVTSNGKQSSNKMGQIMNAYNETEGLSIMAEAICTGALEKITEEVNKKAKQGWIDTNVLESILKQVAMIPDIDSKRVTGMLSYDGKIELPRFNQFVNKSIQYAKDHSQAIKKLIEGCRRHGKSIIQRFETQDHNKDGQLNVDGFKAALLIQELQMSPPELIEVFYLICNFQGIFYYKDWILDNFPTYKQFFTIKTLTRAESIFTDKLEHSQNEAFQTLRVDQSLTLEVDQNKLQSGKTKFENYMRQQEVNLGVIFAILDTDSSKSIDRQEFNKKVRALHMRLEDDEINAIFQSMDMNNSGSITYNELVEMFAPFNTAHIIRMIQKIIVNSKVGIEFYFNAECKDDPTKQKLTQNDFTKLVKSINSKITPAEILHVFRQIDRGHKGYISKDDFFSTFNSDVREVQSVAAFQIGIEDIIKPLATKCKKSNVNLQRLFDRYDKNHNGRLSAEELRDALLKDYSIRLQEDELQVIKDYFINKYKSKEIAKQAFVELIQTNFERKIDSTEARKALFDVKNRLEMNKKSAQSLCAEFSTEQSDLITLRQFKLALNSLKVLTQYSIDNLAKHLDKKNEGFISVSEFTASLSNAFSGDSTMKSMPSNTNSSMAGTQKGKWF